MAEEIQQQRGLDEDARRYYLDAMGIQCWQLLQADTTVSDTGCSTDESSVNKALPNLEQLERAVLSCNECELHQQRKQAIIGRGSEQADLMLVVLAPDTDDDSSGVICSGENNELLTKMLAAIDMTISDIYITSLLKCHVSKKHTITPAEVQQCKPYLLQQISVVQPRLIILLGELTAQCFFNRDITIDEFRHAANLQAQSDGEYQIDSIPVFASYSPAELLTKPENKRKAWSDLQLIEKIIC